MKVFIGDRFDSKPDEVHDVKNITEGKKVAKKAMQKYTIEYEKLMWEDNPEHGQLIGEIIEKETGRIKTDMIVIIQYDPKKAPKKSEPHPIGPLT